MRLKYMKAIIAAVWVLAVCAAGLAGHVTVSSSWTVLVLCAVVPPLIMVRYWKQPPQSMSESIHEVLR